MDPDVIPGAYLLLEALDSYNEYTLMEWIDSIPWNEDLSRRTQHYGYKYDYKSRTALSKTQPLTGPLRDIANKINEIGIMNPNQCIINEYLHGQKISPHIDSLNFGPIVISLSLLEPTTMIFEKDNIKHNVILPPRSLLILKNEARYLWKHSLVPHKGKRRVSCTFRTVSQ